jgi:hypothetical protein
VLMGRLRRLKNNRFQPPIMKMFHPRIARAFDRSALGTALKSRYAAIAKAASIPVQTTGIAQSGGLKAGSRKDKYHAMTRGWLGEGLLEALSASGTVKAHDAMAAAAVAERPRSLGWDSFIIISIDFCHVARKRRTPRCAARQIRPISSDVRSCEKSRLDAALTIAPKAAGAKE